MILSIGICLMAMIVFGMMGSDDLNAFGSIFGAVGNLLAFVWIAATFQLQASQLAAQNAAFVQQLSAAKTDLGLSLYQAAVTDLNEIARELVELISAGMGQPTPAADASGDQYIKLAAGSQAFRSALQGEVMLAKNMVAYLCGKYLLKSDQLRSLLEGQHVPPEISNFLYFDRPIYELHVTIKNALTPNTE